MDRRNLTPFDSVKILMLKGEKGEQGNSGDYSSIDNKPSINGVELSGDKSSASLHLASDSDLDDIQSDILTLTDKATTAEENIQQNSTDIETISDALTPQTETASFTSTFTAYATGSVPTFVKYGRMVMVYGIAKPTETITGSQTETLMFTIPEGYRPFGRVVSVMQGSARHLWTMELTTTGNATFSRLRADTGAYIDAGTAEWLPFSVTYICGE